MYVIARKLVFFVSFMLFLGLASAQEADIAELLNAGDIYYRGGDCLTAIQAYNMVLERDPNNVEAHLGKGRALACEGAVASAAEEFRQVIGKAPDNMSGYVMLAQMYWRQYQNSPGEMAGRLDDALAILQDAERIDGQYPPLYNMRGLVQLERGDLEAARSSFERAIELARTQEAPGLEQSQYHIHAGAVYRNMGQLEQALTSFRRAVALNPSNAIARNYVGWTLQQLGRCEDAIYELEQAVELNPSLRDATANLGIALFECDQVEESEYWLRRALELDPLSMPGLYVYLARVSLSEGRYGEAVESASRAVVLPPNSADAWYWLGRAYESRSASDDVNRARDAYGKALELDPNHAPAREALDSLP
jgi:tetratricopeptide (TPR) repeat protein